MDLAQLKHDYGDKLVFDGTIGTQTTMPFGMPDDVRAWSASGSRTLAATAR